MSDFDPSEFNVNWADRSDSTFYAIDTATYPFRVNNVNWQKTSEHSANPGKPMAKVTLEFPEVRTTKPKKGRPKGSNETEVVTERNRQLPVFFTFSSEYSVEQGREFLIAMEVATPDELEENMEGPTIIKLFNATEGAEGAARVTKYQPDPVKNPRALTDDFGNSNNVKKYFAKGSPQFERAASASGSTIDASTITRGGRKR